MNKEEDPTGIMSVDPKEDDERMTAIRVMASLPQRVYNLEGLVGELQEDREKDRERIGNLEKRIQNIGGSYE